MNNTNFNTFKELHHQSTPLILANAWDAPSAVLFQLDGAKAIATSSAALAWSLGYADGGSLPRQELLAAVRRIMRVLHVPLTVDVEDGYSDSPGGAAELILELAQCGVAGINLEDGGQSPSLLVDKIVAARKLLGGSAMFINARTDVYLRNIAQGEAAIAMTIERLNRYREAGADGAFVPLMSAIGDVKKVAAACSLPLNLMTIPNMPLIDDLFAAGARRISAGPTIFQSSYGHARRLAKELTADHSMTDLFSDSIPYPELNAAFQSK